MFTHLDACSRSIFLGNILLVVCVVFYLAWWIIAFAPQGGIKGLKSGWLLLPAVAAGVAAAVFIIRGIINADTQQLPQLYSNVALLVGGIIVYFVLMAVTIIAFKRQVTTELLLICVWAVMALAEANVLFGLGQFTRVAAWIFIAVIALAVIASLVCYVLYYRLSPVPSFYDGMVPLVSLGLVTAALAVGILV